MAPMMQLILTSALTGPPLVAVAVWLRRYQRSLPAEPYRARHYGGAH